MDLYTRCGNCDTTFRVTTRQLQASGGRVRCGHCQQIFDAFATLTAQEPEFGSQEPVDSSAEQPEDNPFAFESSEQPPLAESPVSRQRRLTTRATGSRSRPVRVGIQDAGSAAAHGPLDGTGAVDVNYSRWAGSLRISRRIDGVTATNAQLLRADLRVFGLRHRIAEVVELPPYRSVRSESRRPIASKRNPIAAIGAKPGAN